MVNECKQRILAHSFTKSAAHLKQPVNEMETTRLLAYQSETEGEPGAAWSHLPEGPECTCCIALLLPGWKTLRHTFSPRGRFPANISHGNRNSENSKRSRSTVIDEKPFKM
eukprot:TRINITY_DN68_c0_g1_i3.p2 TRINITY_DN68_c0_g1~~TRINITY_DN68_c0_g1_i3.p2  ORF type:complete len:111 (+),score=0.18 TRINITY_DN68_c0_g1_i3:3345-3677(+)